MGIFDSKAISKIVENIENLTRDKSNELLVKVHENLVSQSSPNATPRDTGFAVNNWLASSKIPRTDVTENANESGNSITRTISGTRNKNDKLYLANNVNYVVPLNNGHSKKQPVPGWVERAVKAAKKEV